VTITFSHRLVTKVPLAAMSSSPTAGLSRRPLMEVFAQMPDPRDPRGVRHDLATVLTLAQTAVLAGARTLLATAEWTHDAARDTLSRIGISPDQALPSESTIRRTLARLDADDLDARPAGWMATRVGHLAGRRVIAFDGKTMRGARTPAGARTWWPRSTTPQARSSVSSRYRPRATRSPGTLFMTPGQGVADLPGSV